MYPMSGALGSGDADGARRGGRQPGRPVLVIVGDGGFLMGGHELVTAQQNGLHFATLLVNDRAYGVFKGYQMQSTGRTGRRRAGARPTSAAGRTGYGVAYRRITASPDEAPAEAAARWASSRQLPRPGRRP